MPVVVGAFLQWMASEGILSEGEALAEAAHGWAGEILAEAINPANWGPAKHFTMEAMHAGTDVTNRAALQRYMFEQAQRALEESPHGCRTRRRAPRPFPLWSVQRRSDATIPARAAVARSTRNAAAIRPRAKRRATEEFHGVAPEGCRP